VTPQNDNPPNTDLLEVIESLLDLCMSREKEIAQLSKTIEELETRLRTGTGGTSTPKSDPNPKQTFKQGVLVVDDSEIMRMHLIDILLNYGYPVAGEADNGELAVQLFQEKSPALVTMDIKMPVMDGLEATRRIKEIDQEAKIVIVADELDKNTILEAVKAGAVDFLVKPLQIQSFIERISHLIAL